jgi:hypothetical protein
MKIISKFKDYYDYLQGIYGVDNYKVYKRDEIIKESDFELMFDEKIKNQHFFYSFAINNKIYVMVKTSKGFYPLTEQLLKNLDYNDWRLRSVLDYKRSTDLNQKYGKPIIVGEGIYCSNKDWKVDRDPFMKSFSFHKMLSAKELYVEVETFMGWIKDNPPIQNKQTDAEKIVSNGFDSKISFRHRKK